MKMLTVVYLLLFCSSVVSGQNRSTPLPDQHLVTPEEMIKTIIERGSVEGGMQKQIGKMGDAAAVAVTRIFVGRDLTTNDLNAALEIITSSFADPRFVSIEADRQPRTTLLLLRYLDFWARDPAVKEDIAHTRKYVVEQYQKSLSPSK